MHLLYLFIIAVIFHSYAYAENSQHPVSLDIPKPAKAVSYQKSSGRFGDQLMNYLHAKWISYKYDMPLLYVPFPYSDQLVLDHVEIPYENTDLNQFSTVIYPYKGFDVDYGAHTSALYVIPYFPESLSEFTPESGWYYFPVDWEDAGFRTQIKSLIRPLSIQPSLDLPKDRITVAVHVRHGGGFDVSDLWKLYPLKVPPISYYIEQIKKIYEIYNHQPLYVYIFTDYQRPQEYAKLFKMTCKGLDILFDYRKQENNHYSNVLEDFFEMTRFDCLIRPESNFSIMAAKIADFKVMITPIHFIWNKDKIVIDEVEILFSKH
jgi:hypothetical protein